MLSSRVHKATFASIETTHLESDNFPAPSRVGLMVSKMITFCTRDEERWSFLAKTVGERCARLMVDGNAGNGGVAPRGKREIVGIRFDKL